MYEPQRRAFLRGFLRSAPVAAGAAAVAVSASKARAVADPALSGLRSGVESLREQVEAVDKRIEALEAGQRKWLRVALGAAALSLGLDISALF
jgi:hypothetical protein